MESTRGEHVNGSAAHINNAVGNIKENVKEATKQASETVKRMTKDLSDSSCEFTQNVASESKKYFSKAEEYIRSNPLSSIVLTAAVGLLVGRFLKRS